MRRGGLVSATLTLADLVLVVDALRESADDGDGRALGHSRRCRNLAARLGELGERARRRDASEAPPGSRKPTRKGGASW